MNNGEGKSTWKSLRISSETPSKVPMGDERWYGRINKQYICVVVRKYDRRKKGDNYE